MKLCSLRHLEVCYEEGDYCPACRTRDEMTAEIVNLENEIEALKEQLSNQNTQPCPTPSL